jgi:hypothetical protein
MLKSHGRIAVTFVALMLPGAGWAQTPDKWSTIYVGGGVSASFGARDFTVDFDATSGHTGGLAAGQLSRSVPAGGHFGLNRQLSKSFVIGGEVGFGRFAFTGALLHAGDWFGDTRAEWYWSAAGRVGYAVGNVLPYVSIGGWTTRNFAHVRRCDGGGCSTIVGEGRDWHGVRGRTEGQPSCFFDPGRVAPVHSPKDCEFVPRHSADRIRESSAGLSRRSHFTTSNGNDPSDRRHRNQTLALDFVL